MSAIASEGARCAGDHVAAENEVVLSCIGLDRRLSGLRAPTSVSFDVRSGEIAGLDGRGKTTTVNVAVGFVRPTRDPLFGKDIVARARAPGRPAGRPGTFRNPAFFKGMSMAVAAARA